MGVGVMRRVACARHPSPRFAAAPTCANALEPMHEPAYVRPHWPRVRFVGLLRRKQRAAGCASWGVRTSAWKLLVAGSDSEIANCVLLLAPLQYNFGLRAAERRRINRELER